MKWAGEISNTETWSANLHTFGCQPTGESPATFENERLRPIGKYQTVTIRTRTLMLRHEEHAQVGLEIKHDIK